MMLWKMILLFNWMILRFHVKLPGCMLVSGRVPFNKLHLSVDIFRFQHLNKPKIPPRQTLKQTFLGTNISLTPAQTLFKIMFLFRWDMLVSWILPQKLRSNLKMMAPRKTSLFQGFIFWFHVSFRGCNNFILVQCGPVAILNGITTPINGLVEMGPLSAVISPYF